MRAIIESVGALLGLPVSEARGNRHRTQVLLTLATLFVVMGALLFVTR